MDCTKTSGNKKEKCENHEECMKMIQAVLDGSATETEKEHFKMNIELCTPCIEGYELEKSIKTSLHSKIEKKFCPKETIANLKLKLGLSAVVFVLSIINLHL
jgi:hypothetical protein